MRSPWPTPSRNGSLSCIFDVMDRRSRSCHCDRWLRAVDEDAQKNPTTLSTEAPPVPVADPIRSGRATIAANSVAALRASRDTRQRPRGVHKLGAVGKPLPFPSGMLHRPARSAARRGPAPGVSDTCRKPWKAGGAFFRLGPHNRGPIAADASLGLSRSGRLVRAARAKAIGGYLQERELEEGREAIARGSPSV
jgi:hypothetical protein